MLYTTDWDVALQLIYFLTIWTLPDEFVGIYANDPTRIVKGWHPFVCVAAGLWGGLIIGVVTEYYTSNRYSPVQVRAAAVLTHGARWELLYAAASVFTGAAG